MTAYLVLVKPFARKILRILFAMMLFSLQCPVAIANRINHSALWTSMSYFQNINNTRWNYLVNPQVRFIDNRYKLQQINLYLALDYTLQENTDILFGVFRNYIQEISGSVSGENRLWQQLSSGLIQTKKFDISSRSRLEERIMNGESVYANRFRQLFSLEVPFAEKALIIIGNEFFIQLNKPDWVSSRTYAQNRFNVGYRNREGKVSYEIGYLNQYAFNDTNQMTNVLYFNIAYSDKYTHTISDILLEN